jgi:hypothetical protein
VFGLSPGAALEFGDDGVMVDEATIFGSLDPSSTAATNWLSDST